MADKKRELVQLNISALDRLLDISLDMSGGLLLPLNPRDGDKGGCNIVIRGRPGTGKSTLALQLARAICRNGETKKYSNYFSCYASLENAPETMIDHAKHFGWDDGLIAIDCLQDLDNRPSQPRLAEALELILRGCPEAWKTHIGDCIKCTARQEIAGDAAGCPTDCMIFARTGKCPCLVPAIPRQVLFPKLSPRSLRPDLAASDELFWRRYYELENLFNAAACLPQPKSLLDVPELKLVVVDSLNVFGDRPLGREELFRLFDLFTRHGVVGVFIAEEREFDIAPTSTHLQYNTVEYLADIVIAMQSKATEGYELQTIEVVKSRYQRHSHEEHPFRIFPSDLGIRDAGVVIYPSLHAVMRRSRSGDQTLANQGTEPRTTNGKGSTSELVPDASKWHAHEFVQYQRANPDKRDEIEAKRAEADREAARFRFSPDTIQHRIAAAEKLGYILGDEDDATGYSGFRELDRLGDFHPKSASCVAVVGESATFKSSIGRNFALRATVCGYHSIIVTFGDRLETEQFGTVVEGKHKRLGRFEFSHDIFWDRKQGVKGERWDRDSIPELKPVEEDGSDGQQYYKIRGKRLPGHKVEKKCFCIDGHEDSSVFGSLAVMNFVPGMLLPEEFIAELLHEVGDEEVETRRRVVKRVVIDDASRIGISYPLLEKSPTGGELFLTCLVDLLKSRGIDVMLVSSINEEPGCKLVTEQVMALSDAVVNCRFYDVFGQRYVGVTGESSGRTSGLTRAVTPGVIERTGKNQRVLHINNKILGGLVGFESGEIQRPGVSLYVFEENSLQHKGYNGNLDVLLHRAFCQPLKSPDTAQGAPPSRPLIRRQTDVSVEKFGSDESNAVHRSLDVLRDKPIDRTLVVTVDEFWTEKESDECSLEDLTELAKKLRFVPKQREVDRKWVPGESLVPLPLPLPNTTTEGIPYYGNVLLLAYRNDLLPGKELDWHSWRKVSENAHMAMDNRTAAKRGSPEVKKPFEFDCTAEETLSCIFIDILIDAACQKREDGGEQKPLKTVFEAGLKSFLEELDRQKEEAQSITHREQLAQRKKALSAMGEKLLSGEMQALLEGMSSQDLQMYLEELSQPDTETLQDDVRALLRGLSRGDRRGCWRHLRKLKDATRTEGVPEVLRSTSAQDVRLCVTKQEIDKGGPCCSAQLQRLIDMTRGAAVGGLLIGKQEEALGLTKGVVDLLTKACKPAGGPHAPLSPNAAVYCCWYSQLRELVRTCPGLARRLNVVALPSRGFRGDWYLGVAKGSVSAELGKQLIETLCSEAEEYERFVCGVGLPTREAFSNRLSEESAKGLYPEREFTKDDKTEPGFMAWPGAPKTCKLDAVLEIHRNALSRSAIPGYRDFRTVLVTLFRQLIGLDLARRDPNEILKVLGPMVRMFQRKPPA